MEHYFNIAGWPVCIAFTHEDDETGMHLLPSYMPFLTNDEASGQGRAGQLLFRLTVDNGLCPVPEEQCQRVRTFDTGNGDTVVDKLEDGGYQYLIKDIHGNTCALLVCNATFTCCTCALKGDRGNRYFGLNNAIMLVYAFASSHHGTLLIHASLVRHDGHAYAFTAKSGTGKSTQVANWLRTIPGCDMMNDDNPIVRVMPDGHVRIFGSPWSGKTPCYRNVSAPLAAITLIERAPTNYVERLSPLISFGTLLTACSTMKWDESIYNSLCDTVTAVVTAVPVYSLHCTADPESALVCHEAIRYKE